MPDDSKTYNPLAIEFCGVEANLGTLTFSGSTELHISANHGESVVLRIAAAFSGLVITLVADAGERGLLFAWRDPKPTVVSPKWKPASDSNGYEIEFPSLDLLRDEFVWVHGGMKYSVLVSQQQGSGKPGWIKPRREGPQ
jgi:hypothetical protein